MRTEAAAVIGAGPAGLAAANQLALYGIFPVVFEPFRVGGLLRNAGSVKNYPGVLRGIKGADLAALFDVPEKIEKESVTSLMKDPNGGFLIEWDKGLLHGDAVIAATGSTPVRIPLNGVDKSRVFYEIADLPVNRYGSAAVIGGGDAALDYALTLSEKMKVNVYARSGFSGAIPHLLEDASGRSSITLFPLHSIPENFEEDIVVVACGRRRNVGYIHEDLLCSPPDDGSFHLCGDCGNGIYRQVSIAVGDGVKAAMKTAEYLRQRKRD